MSLPFTLPFTALQALQHRQTCRLVSTRQRCLCDRQAAAQAAWQQTGWLVGATVKPLYVLAHSWIPLTGSHMSALTIFTCPAGNILVQFCNTGEALWLLLLVRQEGDPAQLASAQARNSDSHEVPRLCLQAGAAQGVCRSAPAAWCPSTTASVCLRRWSRPTWSGCTGPRSAANVQSLF